MSSPSCDTSAAQAVHAASAATPARPVTSLPPSTPTSMPSQMYYTSLQWLSTASGVPLAVSETPPTSPDRFRTNSNSKVPETPEQRRQRQAAFISEKNKELAELKKKLASGALLQEVEAETASAASSPAKPAASTAIDEGLVTPQKKTSSEALSTPLSSDAATPSDPVTFMSPEKRRAKKLSSLQYPLFSAHWWDVPLRKSARSSKDDDSESLGMVLLGGGGGKKGAGIDSGMLVCSVLPSSSRVFATGSSPIRMSLTSSPDMALNPISFLDSNDFLIGQIAPHPTAPILAATVGAGTAILHATGELPNKLDFSYRSAVQTDFHKELSAQAQAWSPSGNWIVTGGEDKMLRFWSYPELELLAVASGNTLGLNDKDEQHRNAILSLHVNSDGTRVVSCAGDGFIKIWNTAALEGVNDAGEEEEPEEKKESDRVLKLPLIQNITTSVSKGHTLKFQAARFYGKERVAASRKNQRKNSEEEEAVEEGDEDFGGKEEYLIAIVSTIQRGSATSALIKYLVSDWSRVKQVSCGSALLTTMEISDDVYRPFVAIANTDGLVAIYNAETLRCIKKVNKCHDLPSTALTFSPSSLAAGFKSRWLLSASADKSVALIEVPPLKQQGSFISVKLILFALLMLLFAVLWQKKDQFMHLLK